MKKVIITALLVLVAASFAACGCQMSTTDTTPTTESTPATNDTILPDTMPTMGTNIPDPSVDTEMPIYTEGTEDTGMNGTIDNTTETQK